MIATLVVGYGDLDRQDKGVGFYVVRELRRCLGQPELVPEKRESWPSEGPLPHSVFLRELTPALADRAVDYEQLIFVRCHNMQSRPPLCLESLVRDCVPHQWRGHLTPHKLVDMIRRRHGAVPPAALLCVLGHGYDLVQGLSDDTRRLVPQAVSRILGLVLGDAPGALPLVCPETPHFLLDDLGISP